MSKKICKNCKWWEDWGISGVGRGDCRRYPPVGNDGLPKEPKWNWTNSRNWCGEFEEKKNERMF